MGRPATRVKPHGAPAASGSPSGAAWSVALRLGRVSNLPTVWTNALVGTALAGGVAVSASAALVVVALSLFYIGGMFLIDAFDRAIDARERPERPIPSGEISAGLVFSAGFGLLATALALLSVATYGMAPSVRWQTLSLGAALAAALVLYDAWHKGNAFGPVLMGLCRMLAYLTAGAAVSGTLPPELWIAALVALSYLIGVTYVAKQETLARVENLWPLLFLAAPLAYLPSAASQGPAGALVGAALLAWISWSVWLLARPGRRRVQRAVVSLIAGISLVDAVLLAAHSHPELALVAVLAFGLTLGSQRRIAGT